MNRNIFSLAFIAITLCVSGQSYAAENIKIKEFIKYHEASAKKGNNISKFHLGNVYMEGLDGVEKDFEKGFNYLLESADYGYIQAQYNVAAAYKLGKGTPQNNDKALYWYLKAAEQGHAEAQLQSALIFQKRKNYIKMLDLLNKAAMSSSINAQFILAGVYQTGKGVPQNYRMAYIWFSIAAAKGDADAIMLRDALEKKLDGKTIADAQIESSNLFKKINNNLK